MDLFKFVQKGERWTEDTILSLKPLNLREVVSSDVASFIKRHKGSKQKPK